VKLSNAAITRHLLFLLAIGGVIAVLISRTPGPPAEAAAADLFISEYIEGTSVNKSIEIYNGTGASVNLSTGNYVLQLYSNGSPTASQSLTLTATIANGDVYVISNSGANAAILAQTDLTNNTVINFNGDDAVVLRKGGAAGAIVDVIGQIGVDPGTQWGTGSVTTLDHTLRRKSTICAGDTNGSDAFDPATEWDGFAADNSADLGSHTASCSASETAPSVQATTPANNATNVAATANIDITFSEPVNVTGSWFQISCSASGIHTAAVSGGSTTYSLNPNSDFTAGEQCTTTIFAAQVTDVDAIDPPDNMAADSSFTFLVAGTCGSSFTPIYAIQGSGAASPMDNSVVVTEGIVVGDFQGSAALSGFFVQDPSGDANTATSDGIFVFDGAAPAVPVSVGDRVRVTGTVDEFNTLTEITSVTSVLVCTTGNPLPAATVVDLPEAVNNDLERYENMFTVIPETLTVTGNFDLGRFGEVVLSSDGREFQQNNFNRTNSAGALAVADLNERRYIVLDDNVSAQNPDPTPYFDGNNTRRVGDTTTNLTGILTFNFGEYRVQPTVTPTFVSANPRTATPASVGGLVKVSSFNVLNYFNGDGVGGGFPTARGANTATEFSRQRAKIIAAIVAINADVYGIIEIENDGNGAASAIQDLINGLNAATAPGTFAFREGTTPGTDLIKNSIIYKPGSVTPVGSAVNDTDTIWDGQARNPLAQTFTLNSNSQPFTFIVNHFTSKGCSANDTGLDADLGDGQGCDNHQRVLQSQALLDFIEERQTASGSGRVLVMGDLNSYGEEDPIFELEDDTADRLADGPGGLVDLIQRLVPAANRYSFQFDSASGYLDHALATKELDNYVSGVTIWHINADEPTVVDYNVEFKTAGQQALNVGTPYRSSDHDPVIVGLNLISPTAANGVVSGTITDSQGHGVEGAVVSLNGTENRKTITDATGHYQFDNVETSGFYTVTPSRANYSFGPTSRSFSQLGNHTDAGFTASSTGDNSNPLDTPEYFVRQQYVDILGREPDEGGFNYWDNEINACGGDSACVDRRRREVAAAFFIEEEFKDTGSFIYDMYKGSLGRKPVFAEYTNDRTQVIGGSTLAAQKAAFADSFVQRAEFVQKYQGNATAESFVNALLQNVQLELSSQRDALISQYNAGTTTNQSRSLVVRALADNSLLKASEYNAAFVLTEYFGYLRRDPDLEGYNFWVNVIANNEVGNYRGMVCAFITSTEYQRRFSSVVSHSNAECGQ